MCVLEPVPDLRQDALAYEAPDGVADGALLVVQQRVEREEVERVERLRLRGDGHALIVLVASSTIDGRALGDRHAAAGWQGGGIRLLGRAARRRPCTDCGDRRR